MKDIPMGLDSTVYAVRKIPKNMPTKDLTTEQSAFLRNYLETIGEEFYYWRKNYPMHEWFMLMLPDSIENGPTELTARLINGSTITCALTGEQFHHKAQQKLNDKYRLFYCYTD